MTKQRELKIYGKDVLFALDFIINIALIIMITMYYKEIYATVGTANFAYEVLMAANGVFLIGYATSIFTVIIEFIYGTMRIKGKKPYETGTIIQWAMIWVILKCMIMLLIMIVSFLGVDLRTFL